MTLLNSQNDPFEGLTKKQIRYINKRMARYEAFVKRFGYKVNPNLIKKITREMVDDAMSKQMKFEKFQFLDRINRGGCSVFFNLSKKV